MSLRSLTRATAVLGGVLLLAGTAVLVGGPAQAVERDRIVIGEGEAASVTHGPLAGANQGALVDSSTTVNVETCQLVTHCDAIPLTVRPPRTFTDRDAEFYVHVVLSWDTVVVDLPLEGESGVDDLDLWIVNDPFDPQAGPDEDGFAYHSASLAMPERVSMFAPVGDWYLLVNNAASTSLFYTLDVEWATSALPTPFESLPPGFTGSPVKPSLVAPPPVSSRPSPIFDVPTPGVADLALGAPALPDAAFGEGFDDGEGLSDRLAAPSEPIDLEPARVARPAPPSALAVILWMLGLPLVLVSAGAAILQRRRPLLL